VTYIDWQWLPPVLDGGLAIIDYEVSFRGLYKLFNKRTGKRVVNYHHPPL
jgi:hypothetical protein